MRLHGNCQRNGQLQPCHERRLFHKNVEKNVVFGDFYGKIVEIWNTSQVKNMDFLFSAVAKKPTAHFCLFVFVDFYGKIVEIWNTSQVKNIKIFRFLEKKQPLLGIIY